MTERLSELIGAISDGHSVDWDALEKGTPSGRPLRRIRALRALAGVASAHRTIQPARDISDGVQPGRHSTESFGTWGPYRIIGRLGQGVSADVFRAYDPKLDREVALKLLTPFHSGRDHGDAVISEGRNLARVRHPNVAAVYAADRIGMRVGIAMELIEGRSLAEEFQSGSEFTPDRTIQIGLQLCRALTAVHNAGLVHRDVKAQNVIIESGGRLVLTDFGTAVDFRPGQMGLMAGTPAYAAPEMFLGDEVSSRSDIYSVGVLLFRMLTGLFPVEGDTVAAMRQAHSESRRRRLADVRTDLPMSLVEVIDTSLSPNPSDRHLSIGAMGDALEHVFTPSRSVLRRTGYWPAAAAAVVIAVGAGLLINPSRGAVPRAPVSGAVVAGSEGVLVANLVNATGDSELDEVITAVIERNLGRSRQISLIGRERIEDVLRLMQQPVDVLLNEQLAHQVSIRDGGVRVIVAGRIDRLGAVYTIGARALEPHSGRTISSVSEQASSKEELVPALGRLTDRLRSLLGELPQQDAGPEPLERVTTPSLRALRLYTESYRLGFRTKWAGALDLARQAVAIDPQFASAQIWLAWALFRTGADTAEYLPVAQHAVDLSREADDIERSWINASYHSLAGDEAKAVGAYEALLQLKPDHYWAVNNIQGLYRRQGRWQDVIRYQRRMAEMRPSDVPSNFAAAESLARVGDFNAARVYVTRLRGLDLSVGETVRTVGARIGPGFAEPRYREAWIDYFEATELLLQRDIVGATAEVNRILETLPTRRTELRDLLVQKAVRYFATIGQTRRANTVTELFRDRSVFYAFNRAYVAYAASDFASARDHIRESNATPYQGSAAWLMVNLGIPEASERFLLDRFPPNRVDYYIGGSLRLARGDTDAAIPLLEAQLSDAQIMHAAMAHDLAEAWRQRGEIDRAIDALRTAVEFNRRNDAMMLGPFGPEWMPNALLLAELCRAHGCRNEAASVETNLGRLLVSADSDFPSLLELRRLQTRAMKQPSN